MDEATIGARLRILRRWRGMTQVQLADLADLSPSFVSMIENGQRPLDRRSHIAAIASALRVSETDLVGGPHLSADRLQSDPHTTIPALREALQTSKLTVPAVDRARPLPELAGEVNGRIRLLYKAADYVGGGALLPDVLDELHWHTAQAADEAARRHRTALHPRLSRQPPPLPPHPLRHPAPRRRTHPAPGSRPHRHIHHHRAHLDQHRATTRPPRPRPPLGHPLPTRNRTSLPRTRRQTPDRTTF